MSDADLAAAVRGTILPKSPDALVAVYLFGSAAADRMRDDSDLDLAFFAREPISLTAVFDASQALATKLGRDVDLVDLANASTVMRAQVVGYGRQIYVGDRYHADVFEMYALSDYARLQEERVEAVRAFTAAYHD